MAAEDEDRRVLLTYLRELGVGAEEIERADRESALGALIVDTATGRPGTVPFESAAERAGMSVGDAAAAWCALGFADPDESDPAVRPEEIAVLELLGSVGPALLGATATLALARIIGAASSRIADAVVDAFRSEVEAPQRVAGGAYADVVRTYADLVGTALPQLQAAVSACLRRHLVTAASEVWTIQENDSTPRRDLVLCFADLVGWTSLSRTAGSGQLAALVQQFERHVAAAASGHRTRVVKLLGDGAMLVTHEPADAFAFALQLVASVQADASLPAVRVGVAAGPVLTVNGDFHGPVVNLAARLAAAAAPASVLTDTETAARVPSAVFGPPVRHEFRGFTEPCVAMNILAVTPDS
ncbi:MAG: hypothetical protein NVSMB55_16930 [Mycobacteriales bacterium]